MGSGQVALSKRRHLRRLIQGGGALGSGSAQSKRNFYILGRLGERQNQRVGVRQEHAFHGIGRRGYLQRGLILRQSLRQPSPRHRHSLPKRKIKDSHEICPRGAHGRAHLLQHPRDRVRSVAERVTEMWMLMCVSFFEPLSLLHHRVVCEARGMAPSASTARPVSRSAPIPNHRNPSFLG